MILLKCIRVTEYIFLNQWALKQNYYHEGGAPGILKGETLWIGCVPVESKKGLEGLGIGIKGKMEENGVSFPAPSAMYGCRPPGGCEGRGGRHPRRSGRSAGKPLGRACALLPLSLLSLFGFLSVLLLLAPRRFPRKHVGRLFRAVASLPPSARQAVIGNFSAFDSRHLLYCTSSWAGPGLLA